MANSEKTELFSPHDKIDLVIHDGGEWDSYFMFKQLKGKVHHWILDDVNVDKNKFTFEELNKDADYELVQYDLEDRNGWAHFKYLSF
jgi:hypothetical protein